MAGPSFLASWLTPTSLFVFLNLVIGTIYLTSRLASPSPRNNKNPQYPPPPPLARSASLLERARSINFSLFKFPEPHAAFAVPEPGHPAQLQRAPSLLERVRSINLHSLYGSGPGDLEPETEQEHRDDRASGLEQPAAEKMRKSASERAVAATEEREAEEEEERVELRRPKSESVLQKTVSFGDEAVDAKADDFINRFKNQLKLQRLESILRSRAQ